MYYERLVEKEIKRKMQTMGAVLVVVLINMLKN